MLSATSIERSPDPVPKITAKQCRQANRSAPARLRQDLRRPPLGNEVLRDEFVGLADAKAAPGERDHAHHIVRHLKAAMR